MGWAENGLDSDLTPAYPVGFSTRYRWAVGGATYQGVNLRRDGAVEADHDVASFTAESVAPLPTTGFEGVTPHTVARWLRAGRISGRVVRIEPGRP